MPEFPGAPLILLGVAPIFILTFGALARLGDYRPLLPGFWSLLLSAALIFWFGWFRPMKDATFLLALLLVIPPGFFIMMLMGFWRSSYRDKKASMSVRIVSGVAALVFLVILAPALV